MVTHAENDLMTRIDGDAPMGRLMREHAWIPFALSAHLVHDDGPLPVADYIVMNGVLTEKRGLSFDQMRDYMERLLARVWPAARVGITRTRRLPSAL